MDGILDWYWLGVALGLGLAVGIAAAKQERRVLPLVLTGAAGVGVGLIAAFALPWALLASLGGLLLAVLALRRLSPEAVPAAMLVVGVLAVVPVLGYVEAAAAPLLGQRLRRRAGSRFAGLRVLAKD
jgi:hypothetical protein